MTTRAVSWRKLAAIAVATAAPFVMPAHAAAQTGYTNLPVGLTFSEVLLASALPIDPAGPGAWSSQIGGGQQGPDAVPVHYSAFESTIRVPGLSADSVRTVLETTLRTELAARGVQILERPHRPGAPPAAAERGDAWNFPWRASGSGASGWVTMLIVPGDADQVRLMLVTVEVRKAA